MIHLGSNDCRAGNSTESTLEELKRIITALRDARPEVVLLAAKIIPMRPTHIEPCVEEVLKGQAHAVAIQFSKKKTPTTWIWTRENFSNTRAFPNLGYGLDGKRRFDRSITLHPRKISLVTHCQFKGLGSWANSCSELNLTKYPRVKRQNRRCMELGINANSQWLKAYSKLALCWHLS